ncbi:MAG: flagellin FliC, partial [Vampirovibrionia bacterium]
MGLTINTNIASQIAQNNLSKNTKNILKTNERLSTGLRINHASDDAAGLSISERLETQIKGTTRAASNAQDGISLLQITEGALSTMIENLQRIREVTVQAGSDTYASTERQAIRTEVESRVADIQMTKAATKFNKITLLDGSISAYILRVGANADNATNTLDISDALTNTLALFLSTDSNTAALSNAFASGTGARNFLGRIDEALKDILTQRRTLGALQSRLE